MSNYRLSAAILSAILIGGGLFFYEQPKPVRVERPQSPEKPKIAQGFGYIDLEQIQSKMSAGDELKELRGKEIRLRLELNEIMRPVPPPQFPEIDTTPFEESAREKNMQNIVSQFAELRARKKRLAEEYRKSSETEYLQRRDAITKTYLNEAFNITLKLENADILRLKPEEISELEKKLDQLVIERNASQGELLSAWMAEIESYVESQTAEDEARIRRESEENLQKYSDEALQKIREVQERNRALREEAIREVAIRQTRRREILAELTETSKARAELEDKILSAIVDEAGRLGATYKLQMVFVRRAFSFDDSKFFYNTDMNFKLDAPKSPGAVIFFGKDARNLTQDLIKALRL